MADTDLTVLSKELNIYAKIVAKQANALNLEMSFVENTVNFATFISG